MRGVALRRSCRWLLVLSFVSNGPGCALLPPSGLENDELRTVAEPFAGAQSDCLPRFPDHDGWYGGDAAYSVPLPISEGRVSLWLFGDSFVERPEHPGERSYPFIHNSIGLSLCDAGGNWHLETFWRTDPSGGPLAFFQPDPDAEWVLRAVRETGDPPYYWPFDGFVVNDVLFVSLLRVARSDPRGPFNLPFRLVGTDLARIENFRDPPSSWQIRISTLSEDQEAFPGSAFARLPDHVDAFTFLDGAAGHSPRVLTRIALRRLARWRPDLSEDLETLVDDSAWAPGLRPEEAAILMDDDASEMSVHFDPLLKQWIAVYSPPSAAIPSAAKPDPDPKPEGSGFIRFRRAASPSGPWSEPENLLEIPELRGTTGGSADPHLFCYAGKAHPQFSTAGRLVITYVCSLFARDQSETEDILERLRETPGLYRPRAISIAFPPDRE
ncbi:MAG TPA: DUF4185 domain-containing protein [Deltaproteobacteria bacterium]|nr:DUF4185 domain-containing protein [Deltaproteobacteria bacterium]